MQLNWSQHCPGLCWLPVRYIWIIEFSSHIIFGHDEQTQWPRDSQQIDERVFERGNDVRNRGVWSSIKWLSNGQIEEFIEAVLQIIFEQSINSLPSDIFKYSFWSTTLRFSQLSFVLKSRFLSQGTRRLAHSHVVLLFLTTDKHWNFKNSKKKRKKFFFFFC